LLQIHQTEGHFKNKAADLSMIKSVT
jgi:hypothetical protein